jgi:hypothetical protein
MRRFLFAFSMVVFAAGSLGAQIRRPRVFTTGEPASWFTAGIAGFTSTGVNDGRTASTWDFGNSTNWQYRASLEKTVGTGGSSFGVSGSWARVPFVYSANLLTPLPANISGTRCGSCDAHMDVMTALATFHSGAGQGFHQVIELNGGIISYQNLKRDSDKATLAGGRNIDPLFSIGYGIGYGFSDRTQIDFVPDYAIAIHERTGLSNGVSNTNSMRALRATLRMGFGARSVSR